MYLLTVWVKHFTCQRAAIFFWIEIERSSFHLSSSFLIRFQLNMSLNLKSFSWPPLRSADPIIGEFEKFLVVTKSKLSFPTNVSWVLIFYIYPLAVKQGEGSIHTFVQDSNLWYTTSDHSLLLNCSCANVYVRRQGVCCFGHDSPGALLVCYFTTELLFLSLHTRLLRLLPSTLNMNRHFWILLRKRCKTRKKPPITIRFYYECLPRRS